MERKEIAVDLDTVAEGLHSRIDTALDTSKIRDSFESMLAQLREKEAVLRQNVDVLQKSKDTLMDEIGRNQAEERQIADSMKQLNEQRMSIMQELEQHELRVKELRDERKELGAKLDQTKDAFIHLKERLDDFHKEF